MVTSNAGGPAPGFWGVLYYFLAEGMVNNFNTDLGAFDKSFSIQHRQVRPIKITDNEVRPALGWFPVYH